MGEAGEEERKAAREPATRLLQKAGIERRESTERDAAAGSHDKGGGNSGGGMMGTRAWAGGGGGGATGRPRHPKAPPQGLLCNSETFLLLVFFFG